MIDYSPGKKKTDEFSLLLYKMGKESLDGIGGRLDCWKNIIVFTIGGANGTGVLIDKTTYKKVEQRAIDARKFWFSGCVSSERDIVWEERFRSPYFVADTAFFSTHSSDAHLPANRVEMWASRFRAALSRVDGLLANEFAMTE
jgi:hypothetical protein